jgi:WASH complex subunit 7
LSAVNLIIEILSFPPSEKNIMIVKIILPIAIQKLGGSLKESSFEEIKTLLKRLDLLSNFEDLLNFSSDCSFLYFSRELVESYFKHLFKHPSRAYELKYIFYGLEDCEKMLKKSKHTKTSDELLVAYQDYITSLFETVLILPLSEKIEYDLRLQIHSNVLGGNEIKKDEVMKDLGIFFQVKPIRFLNKYIDIKSRITHYLDKTFYNLTTLTQNDWKTYEQMRNLCKKKYGLILSNVYLPTQTLGKHKK